MQEAADAAELCLFEEDDVVDVGIVLEDRIGGLFDDPRQVCLGEALLDGIRNGQGMNHIADCAQFDNQDVLHVLPSFHRQRLVLVLVPRERAPYFRPARSIMLVVDLPATSGIKATSPP